MAAALRNQPRLTMRCRPRFRPHRAASRLPGAVLGCSMIEKDEILAALRAALPGLKQRWPIGSLAIFGSVARGNASAKSDLDVLVEFERPIGLSEFLALEDALSAFVDR